MPAAAISVHSADAVDGKFFHLDLFQDAGLFTARLDCLLFSFHGVLLLIGVGFAPLGDASFVCHDCNADAN